MFGQPDHDDLFRMIVEPLLNLHKIIHHRPLCLHEMYAIPHVTFLFHRYPNVKEAHTAIQLLSDIETLGFGLVAKKALKLTRQQLDRATRKCMEQAVHFVEALQPVVRYLEGQIIRERIVSPRQRNIGEREVGKSRTMWAGCVAVVALRHVDESPHPAGQYVGIIGHF